MQDQYLQVILWPPNFYLRTNYLSVIKLFYTRLLKITRKITHKGVKNQRIFQLIKSAGYNQVFCKCVDSGEDVYTIFKCPITQAQFADQGCQPGLLTNAKILRGNKLEQNLGNYCKEVQTQDHIGVNHVTDHSYKTYQCFQCTWQTIILDKRIMNNLSLQGYGQIYTPNHKSNLQKFCYAIS